MADAKKPSTPFPGIATDSSNWKSINESLTPGRGIAVNSGSTVGNSSVRSNDGFVTRNAAPPPVSDIPARPKGK